MQAAEYEQKIKFDWPGCLIINIYIYIYIYIYMYIYMYIYIYIYLYDVLIYNQDGTL